MDEAAYQDDFPRSEAQLKELASLARLVSFARQNARDLNAEFSAYCLDLALGALLQELNGHAPKESGPSEDIMIGALH